MRVTGVAVSPLLAHALARAEQIDISRARSRARSKQQLHDAPTEQVRDSRLEALSWR
jgi:hypothetical protein